VEVTLFELFRNEHLSIFAPIFITVLAILQCSIEEADRSSLVSIEAFIEAARRRHQVSEKHRSLPEKDEKTFFSVVNNVRDHLRS
jgi:hypothetical protein